MNCRWTVQGILWLCIVLVGCNESTISSENVPQVVTADIQAGIEKHIEEKTRMGEGSFRLPFNEEELVLKLIRVHKGYLANLGPRYHFACVDLASADGNVYDVDFFLAGDPGEMTVTETTIHKVNGKPLYVWKQKRGKTWCRVPVEGATPDLLGVIKGRDKFEFHYRATLPEMTDSARIWIPLPRNDFFQTVNVKSIKSPVSHEILEDKEHGNKVFFMALEPDASGETIEILYEVERLEKPVYEDSTRDPTDFLRPERLVPESETFSKIAEEVVEGKSGDLARARALYDHTIDRMKYMKYGDGWGKGDAVYACDARTGNCTDFHSYFIALSRAVGIPARFAIGASIPSSRDEGGISGYHCWAEFYGDGKWWPVDISEGDKCAALTTYYFGHHPANRIEFSRGRDLVVEPGPASGPINFLAYPVLEIGGEMAKAKIEFGFKRISASTS